MLLALANAPTAQAWPELLSAAAPSRILMLALGLGLETTLQLVPFHCSISVCSTPLLITDPTAQMSVAEMIAIPLSSPAPGLEITLQLLPFHCSIRVPRPLGVPNSPTAHTSFVAPAAAANRTLNPEPTLGLATTLHVWPFQCRVSVGSGTLASGRKAPTAQMSLAEAAVTPFRKLLCVPTFGLETTLHVWPFQCSMRV